MTGSNLAVSGKAAWFGTTAGESRRMVRAGTSPDEELAVTGAEDLQGRRRPQLLLFAAAPADRGPAHWRSPVPGGPGSPVSAGQAGHACRGVSPRHSARWGRTTIRGHQTLFCPLLSSPSVTPELRPLACHRGAGRSVKIADAGQRAYAGCMRSDSYGAVDALCRCTGRQVRIWELAQPAPRV
jgi:hypothetical protein